MPRQCSRFTLCGFKPLKLDAVGADLGKVILRLLHKPAFGTAAENLFQTHVTEAVANYGLKTAPCALHQRATFGNALTAGQTAQEFEPEGKAAQETAALHAWLRKLLKSNNGPI
jgi:hypothetical protein